MKTIKPACGRLTSVCVPLIPRCGRLASVLLVLIAAGIGAGLVVGCGNKPTESISSEEIVRDAERGRNDRRLARLEQRLTQLRRAPPTEREAPAAAPATDPTPLAGFGAFARSLDGEVGVAVGAPGSGQLTSAGSLTSGSAWSTIKVPIALRVLQDAGGPDGLDAARSGQIERAITASDNAAAAELFADLSSRHGGVPGAASVVTETLRAAGDDATVVSTQGRDGFSPYGQTDWSLRSQARFMSALAGGCVGDAASADYVLELMGRVTSDRWGLGSVGVPARWKGGWGPGSDGRYLVRQMGIIESGGEPFVVTLAARPSDGQFASGQALATQVAAWVVQRAPTAAADLC